jgi:uncharacterized protein
LTFSNFFVKCWHSLLIPGRKGTKNGSLFMEHDDFTVLLENILPEGLEKRLEVREAEAEELRLAMPLSAPLGVELSLTRHGSRVLVRGTIRGAVTLECSRCLAGFSHPVEAGLETHLEIGEKKAAATDHEPSLEELDVQQIDKGCIDLRELIAEQVHLAVPLKPLCSEGCRGLCAHCGADLNTESCSCEGEQTDPRWDALKHLKEQ